MADEEGWEAIAAKSWFQSVMSNPCLDAVLLVTLPLTEKAVERVVANFFNPTPEVDASD